jgi:hypothetical protein
MQKTSLSKKRGGISESVFFSYIPRNALARKTAIWARVTGFPGP